MEKRSSLTNPNTLPFFVLIDEILLHTISNWSSRVQNGFSRFQSAFLQSQENCCNSKLLEEKNWDSESRRPQLVCEKRDGGSLRREDVQKVMGGLGIFCGPEGEQLLETFSSDELTGLFDEKEPSLGEVKEAFNVFDENKDGFIDARELQRVLCILGLKEGSKLEDCQKMIRSFDKNGDGRIEFNEFVKVMEASLC
ncbi:probable calcium-binding protein CML46 [Pyrus x bretschneideri]|uniref:probable calcium-binding protein CML46 n=1 Tax=Pyrus x bretschneideri TaxID=225117 RepID=UPI000510F19F|nr:probable calcium-binding protein CML46 [Pyrus x bretschneideri]